MFFAVLLMRLKMVKVAVSIFKTKGGGDVRDIILLILLKIDMIMPVKYPNIESKYQEKPYVPCNVICLFKIIGK